MQSVPITTSVVNSNPVHDEVYSIQHYVIKFVSDLLGQWFFPGSQVSSINETDCHDMAEILLKVADFFQHHKPNQTHIKFKGFYCHPRFPPLIKSGS